MGVVNVTPDSFSDGGLFFEAGAAIAHGLELERQGAEILDVGGESTRPGAEPVAEDEELRRVLPVIEGLAPQLESRGARISVDTSKAAVARAALRAGATLVNDVTALRGDPGMVEVVAAGGAECCLMHMRGEPRTMQRGAGGDWYDDVVDDVKAFLEERLRFAIARGIGEERILLDPGIGFGKTLAHNLELLRRLDELLELGRPLLVGTSRKSFLGRILAAAASPRPSSDAGERLAATLATCVLAYERGARVFRVHDVAPAGAALATAAATLGARWTTTTS
ncbi:MAG TPA: dihydropteroate synthase [Solirubrobacteraceae bacterium]|jgi:dihydropteroate synthase|nr:dihydropteroate synthase [Solirubrobacteraceae bacterium]